MSANPRGSARKRKVGTGSETARKRSRVTSDDVRPKPAVQSLKVFVFGEGSSGELGLGTGKKTTEVKTPRLNSYLTGIKSCATGGMHAAALTLDNRVLTWGVNDNGALGRDTQWLGNLVDINTGKESGTDSSDDEDGSSLNPKEAMPTAVDPESFPEGTNFLQVTAGDSATFALTDQGHVYGWGSFRDSNGVYGFTLNTSERESQIVKNQWRPIRIPGLENIVQISSGADFALALNMKGQAFAWGCGQQCELGRPLIDRFRPKALLPTWVGLPRKAKIRSVHAASNHAFAIDDHGDTWAWGLNNFGQTGIISSAGQAEAVVSKPTRVASLVGRNMQMISGGLHHSIGLTLDGECLVWGRLDGDQMGLDIQALLRDQPASILHDEYGKPRCLLEPTTVPIGRCRYVAAGSDHCLAVTYDNKAYSWGFNATYQCGQPTDDDVKVATLMNGKAIREASIVWAGAGGQFSMLAAAKVDEATV